MIRPCKQLDARFVPVPDASNTAAVVVSYFPGDRFEQRLSDLSAQFAAVFWVDNTPRQRDDAAEMPGGAIHYLSKGENIGLADALNLGCRDALAAGFSWVATFDQDSLVAADFLKTTIECWQQSVKPVFILGCNYTDSAAKNSPRFSEGGYLRECRTVITSGSLMCLSVWRDLGEFRGDYFIDGVDHEICLRARAHDLLIARHGRVLMQHQIGEASRGLRFLPYVQPAGRMYYSTRNGVRNIVDFASSEPLWATRKVVAIAWESLVALLLGPDRTAKIRAVWAGLVDGVRGSMGPAQKDWTDR